MSAVAIWIGSVRWGDEPAEPAPVLTDRPTMRPVSAGTYALPVDGGAWEVTLCHPFELDETEITQAEYRRVMGAVPNETATATTGVPCASAGVGADLPVTCVSWADARRFCNLLTDEVNATRPEGLAFSRAYRERPDGTWERDLEATGYRLPTEAGWWVAARADTPQTAFSGSDSASAVACFGGTALCAVRSRAPNGWGFYDFSGNAMEWVGDAWSETLAAGAATDPKGPAPDGKRVLRGGGYSLDEARVRTDFRLGAGETAVLAVAGFGVARTLPEPAP